MVVEVVRWAVIGAVLVLLGRAARAGWAQRRLSVRVWRSIRPRHVAGALGLLGAVLGTALALLVLVPPSGIGLGSFIGLDGNAIFAPIDAALEAPLTDPGAPDGTAGAGTAAAGGADVDWGGLLLVSGFLGLLVALFPTLASAEEVAFRLGWEDLPLPRQLASALRFGLVHLVMLIPVAAALAIGVAGFAYGRVYLRAYRRAAVPVRVIPEWSPRLAEDAQGYTRLVAGPPSPITVVDEAAGRRAALHEATVWHTTFNTLVAALVWLGYVLSALA